MKNIFFKIFEPLKKSARENPDVKVHVGELKGSYDYYINFKKKHPTYDTIVSDVL